MSNLTEAVKNKVASGTKTKTTTSVRTSTETKKDNKPPAGATILESNTSTSTEEIENGWLITKSYDGRYTVKGDTDSYGHYFNYNKKWYSKTDPLTITLNDKSLSDAFDDDNN